MMISRSHCALKRNSFARIPLLVLLRKSFSNSQWPKNILNEEDFQTRAAEISKNIFRRFKKAEDAFKSDYLHDCLVKDPDGIRVAMRLREDSLEALKLTTIEDRGSWIALDSYIKNWLSIVFCDQALSLRRITFEESSGNVLEEVARFEAVHRVRSLNELKRRLHNGRRCYGLFHHSLSAEPLAFIHIALMDELAESMKQIDSCTTETPSPKCAIFYSVNSPHPSLGGLDLATQLIHRASSELGTLFPSLQYYSTLSPIPGFMAWLGNIVASSVTLEFPVGHKERLDVAYLARNPIGSNSTKTDCPPTTTALLAWLHSLLASPVPMWTLDDSFCEAIRESLMWLCTIYLAREKHGKGLPLDPVARFHLRNGAILHRINWFGNPTKSGFASSAGLMVNYLYHGPPSNESYTGVNILAGDACEALPRATYKSLDLRAEYFNSNRGTILVSDSVKKILISV